MTQTTIRKPRRKVRYVTLGTMTNGKRVVWLTQDANARAYVLTELRSDIGGRAFRLGKADNGDGKMETYDVLIHEQQSSCTCAGHTYRPGKCKHILCLRALVAAGKI